MNSRPSFLILTILLGFGLYSVVESLPATVLVWRFRKTGKIADVEKEKIEKKSIEIQTVSQ